MPAAKTTEAETATQQKVSSYGDFRIMLICSLQKVKNCL